MLLGEPNPHFRGNAGHRVRVRAISTIGPPVAYETPREFPVSPNHNPIFHNKTVLYIYLQDCYSDKTVYK